MKGAPGSEAEDAWVALLVLGSICPTRQTARRTFLNLLEREFQATGMQVPDWIEELRRRLP